MTHPDPFDGHDDHLSERMDRAVGGLRAPDVIPHAVARGRQQRTRRRLTYVAGGVAAATALVLSVPAFAGDWPGRGESPTGTSVATDPTATPTTATPSSAGAPDNPCGAAATGWWSKSAAQIESDLAGLLPEGTRIGETNDRTTGTWGGNLVSGGDADFASLTLLPPPGTPGGRLSLAELSDGGTCAAGSHQPLQAVKPCAELGGVVSCEEIRSEDGALVGVVTEQVEQPVVDGQQQPTDKNYVLATYAVPDGGHVELYVAEGTRADRPSTVHDRADVPALTTDQAQEIAADPVWTQQ